MTQPPPLTFEKFVERVPLGAHIKNDPGIPRYNNFGLHFVGGTTVREYYRGQPHFKRFEKENPDLEKRLSDSLANPDRSVSPMESFKLVERDMHEAYLIMREYEGVSDEDLFR
jgi:hypothetical protein